jgi:hypothetical protein
MNTQAVHSFISPFQFLTHNFNPFKHNRDSEIPGFYQAMPEINQSSFTHNPQRILENQLARGIEKAMGGHRIPLSQADNSEFNPDKIADSVLAYINQTYGQLQNTDPDFDKSGFFNQIKQGIETGFSEARDALEQLGLLQSPLKDGLDAAYAKLQKSLSKLQAGNQPSTASINNLQGFSAQIKESAEIEIVTKEGDTVKIRLGQSGSNRHSVATIQQNGITASSLRSHSESSSDFSVSIEGNLNEEEQQSLNNLLKQMDEIGKEFFNGDIETAFNHAQKIGLDTAQLASFSMSLSMEKSIQAVAAYQQAGFPDQPFDPEKVKQAADFFSQARKMLESAESALEAFANPQSAFNVLFDAINQSGIEKHTECNPAKDTTLLQQIIKPLSEGSLENGKLVPV